MCFNADIHCAKFSLYTFTCSGASASAVAVGGGHTCALLAGGDVECWGYNQYGQLGNGGTSDAYYPTAVSLGMSVEAVACVQAMRKSCNTCFYEMSEDIIEHFNGCGENDVQSTEELDMGGAYAAAHVCPWRTAKRFTSG